MRKSKTTETKDAAKLVRCDGTRNLVPCESMVENVDKYNFCKRCAAEWAGEVMEFLGKELREKTISDVAAELDEVLGDG
jgi:hypothetical protein